MTRGVLCLLLGGCCCATPPKPSAQPAQLSEITVTPGSIGVGAAVALVATWTGSDPARAPSFAWAANDGTVDDHGAALAWQPSSSGGLPLLVTQTIAVWHAPMVEGSYSVQLAASNPDGDLDRTATVNVAGSTSPDEPVVVVIDATPNALKLSQSSDLVAIAFDNQGDPLTYTWNTAFGTVVGTTASARYTAPDQNCCPELVPVDVTVDDGRGHMAPGTIDLQVTP